jgi:Protein of unknown function (DUF4007)
MSNFRFSGHETFHCRHFWLKKGFDYINQGLDFKDPESVVNLGVGKNMVSSIQHWLNAFNILDNNTLSEFSKYVFEKEGYDAYLENNGSLWLLHYFLLKKDYASLYKLTFLDFRKTRISAEFSEEQLNDFILKLSIRSGLKISPKTIENDVKVLIRNYVPLYKKGSKSLEDDFSSLLINLDLITKVNNSLINGAQEFRFLYDTKVNLPSRLLLFAILDSFEEQLSIAVNDIQIEVSDMFLCNREGTENKLQELQELGYIVYKEDAGRKEIQIKKKVTKWTVLKDFYEKGI